MNIEFPCKGYRVTLLRDFTYDTYEGSRTIPADTILAQAIGEPYVFKARLLNDFGAAGLQADGWRLVLGHGHDAGHGAVLNEYRVIPRDQIRIETLTIDVTETEVVLP